MYSDFYRQPQFQPAPYQQQFQPQQQIQAPTLDERIWVQNENAAEAYLVAPNSFVRLWDANNNMFYEKRTDATGRPLPMEVYEYKLRQPQAVTEKPNNNDVTIELQKQIEALQGRIEALEKAEKGPVKANAKRKSDADDTDAD